MMKRLFFSATMMHALLFLSLPALAQTSMFMSISWVPPTTTTAASGSQPLTGANAITAYKIYAATSPLTAAAATPTTTAPAGQTSAGATVMALPGQTVYVYVTACNAAGCSALSLAGTKIVPGVAATAIPNVPTGVTIVVLVPATS